MGAVDCAARGAGVVSWPLEEFKNVAEVVTGLTLSKKITEYLGDKIPIITLSELME